MNLKTKMTSRRGFLQGAAGVGGVMVVPLSMAKPLRSEAFDSPAERAQIAFIEAVLHKHTGRSRKLKNAQVRLFAQRFTEEYGVVDYKSLYHGIAGEYRLTRLFVRSTRLPAATAQPGALA